MKYLIVIPDGAADGPVEELDGLTPLEAAETPTLDWLTQSGRLGSVQTIPDQCAVSTDVGLLSILGYDPGVRYTGQAFFEAVGLGVPLESSDRVVCCQFVTVDRESGVMIDHTAGGLSTAEAGVLLRVLAKEAPEWLGWETVDHLEFVTDDGPHHLLIDRSGRDYSGVDIPDCAAMLERPVDIRSSAGGEAGELLRALMVLSRDLFQGHEVNLTRLDVGDLAASQIWLWGPTSGDRRRAIRPFVEHVGIHDGVMISHGSFARGMASCLGWSFVDVSALRWSSGWTSESLDFDAMLAGVFEQHDVACVYTDIPKEFSCRGDFSGKVEAIRWIDSEMIGPAVEMLDRMYVNDWRMLVVPACGCSASTRQPERMPVPFVLAGSLVTRGIVPADYHERGAERTDLYIEEGHQLMEYFLRGGLSKRF